MRDATTEEKPIVFDRLVTPVFKLYAVYSGEEALVPPMAYTPGRGGPAGTLRLVDEG